VSWSRGSRRYVPALVGFAGVVLLIAVAAAVAQIRTLAANVPMERVAAHAMPALEHLAVARTALHMCEAAAEESPPAPLCAAGLGICRPRGA
jgi:hypothetical protein